VAAIKDHYIRALQYAESKSEFTLEELVAELRLTTPQENQLALQIHEKQIFQQNGTDYINRYSGGNIKLHLSVEDKFKLLNYTALEEARSSAISATRFAIAAMVIAIVSSTIAALLSIKQINSDANIPEGFVQKINEISKSQTESLNNISQANQILITQKLGDISKSQFKSNDHLADLNKFFIKIHLPQKPHKTGSAVP
jgi:hypothetical protein